MKKKGKDVKLLLCLVVAMSVFNLLSMQFYVSGFSFGSAPHAAENSSAGGATQSENADRTASTSKTSEKNSGLNLYNFIRNKFSTTASEESAPQTTQGNVHIQPTQPTTPQSESALGSTPQNENQNQAPAHQEEQNDNTNPDDTDENEAPVQDDSDPENPLDDEVPPNESGPPAESVDGKDLEFHFGSGLSQ